MKYCESCGKEISDEECESYDGLCWECWDDQMTMHALLATKHFRTRGYTYTTHTHWRDVTFRIKVKPYLVNPK